MRSHGRYFHNVNIISGGTLKFDDALTDFYAKNIVVENRGSLTAGTTTKPVGNADGRVTIHLWGAPGDPGVTCNSANCGVPTPPFRFIHHDAQRGFKSLFSAQPLAFDFLTQHS